MKRRPFEPADLDAHISLLWHDLPMRAREELTVAKLVQQIPNRMLHRRFLITDQEQPSGFRTDQVLWRAVIALSVSQSSLLSTGKSALTQRQCQKSRRPF